MPLIQDHDMIQALTANRTDQPFREGILPWAPGCGDDLLHGQGVNTPTKCIAIDSVTIPNQVPLRIAFRECFSHLLTRPLCRRMFRHAKVQNPSALMLDDEEDKQYPQPDRWDGEKVDGNDLPEVIFQECPPGLRRRPLDGLQDARHGSFGHRDSELE